VGGKRNRNRKKRVSPDIRRLKEQPAVPGIIRLTDGGFAERLAGKYAWRTAGRAARGAMVHRMMEQARTPETIAVQLQLMLRQIRLMVPLHLRIEYRAPALPPAERRDAAARGAEGGRRMPAADAARGSRSPSGEGSRSGGRGPAERHAERRAERHIERQVERAVERRIDRLAERRTGGIEATAAGRRPELSASAVELPATRAFRLLADAVRTPLFGPRSDAEGGGRIRVRTVSSAPALHHQQPARFEASAIAAPRPSAPAPQPRTQAGPNAERTAGRQESSPRATDARSAPDTRRQRRAPAEPDEREARRPSAERTRSVPASPAVSASAEPLARLARAALQASALPAASLSPAPTLPSAPLAGPARRVAGRTDEALRTGAGAVRPDAGAVGPESGGAALSYIAARYRHRRRTADGRTDIVHRTAGERGGREDGVRERAALSWRLERLVRQARDERAAERVTLARAIADRLARGGTAAAGRTAQEPSRSAPVDGARSRAASANAGSAPATAAAPSSIAAEAPPDVGPPVARRAIPTPPANLSHAPAVWRAALAAANTAAATAAEAAVRLAAVASARAAARGFGQAAGSAGSGAEPLAAPSGTDTRSVGAVIARSARARAPIVVARLAAANADGGVTRQPASARAASVRPGAGEPASSYSPTLQAAQLARSSAMQASRIIANASRERFGAPARPDAGGPVPAARAAVAAAPRLVTLRPPSAIEADMRTSGGIVRTGPEQRPAARNAVPVQVARRTATTERDAPRPYEPRRRTVPSLVQRQARSGPASGGVHAAGAAAGRHGVAIAPAAVRQVAPADTRHAAPAAPGGRESAPGLPVTRGITPVARQPVRRGLTSAPLTVRRSLPTAAASPAVAAGLAHGAMTSPDAVSSPQPAELRFAFAGRQGAQAEEIARGIAGANRSHERRQVRDVPLQVAARTSGRTGETSPVINELKSAILNVEKELGRMKEDKPAPAVDFNRLADELYKAVNRRFRLDQHRRGF